MWVQVVAIRTGTIDSKSLFTFSRRGYGDIAGQPTSPTSMVKIFDVGDGPYAPFHVKNPSMRPVAVAANHAPPLTPDVVSLWA
jgi:hypothetical protein